MTIQKHRESYKNHFYFLYRIKEGEVKEEKKLKTTQGVEIYGQKGDGVMKIVKDMTVGERQTIRRKWRCAKRCGKSRVR